MRASCSLVAISGSIYFHSGGWGLSFITAGSLGGSKLTARERRPGHHGGQVAVGKDAVRGRHQDVCGSGARRGACVELVSSVGMPS